HGEVVHPVELPRLAPVAPELREDPAALAQERPDVVVLAVGVVEPGLGRVVRDVHVPHRAAAARRGRDPELLEEGPVPPEDLDAGGSLPPPVTPAWPIWSKSFPSGVNFRT